MLNNIAVFYTEGRGVLQNKVLALLYLVLYAVLDLSEEDP